MLTELIQASIKKNYSKELREIIDTTTEQMQVAGVAYQGTCIPFKSKEERGFIASAVAGVDAWDLESAIYATSALKQAGAKFIFSLKNNVQVPLCNNLTAHWAPETGAAKGDADPQFSEQSIAPHRLTTYITVSKMLLNQTQNVESLLTEMLATAINQKLEQSIFRNCLNFIQK
ncbi:phage major capsid protein, partial [Bacteroides sp. CAG:633]|uniref:phage major capsid protein n=1 Tax=Bacteroides sp. CAG:633 TaxID=1262744 RepID=UPI000B0CF26E